MEGWPVAAATEEKIDKADSPATVIDRRNFDENVMNAPERLKSARSRAGHPGHGLKRAFPKVCFLAQSVAGFPPSIQLMAAVAFPAGGATIGQSFSPSFRGR
jgi:hypothetical protein